MMAALHVTRAEQLIDVLGGSTLVARKLRLRQSTVAEMKRRKSIPLFHWPKFLKLAADAGIELDYERLVQMHIRRKRKLGTHAAALPIEAPVAAVN